MNEIDRRMRLLELAGGDLARAQALEGWVLHGSATLGARGWPTTEEAATARVANLVLPDTHEQDGLNPPEFLKRPPKPDTTGYAAEVADALNKMHERTSGFMKPPPKVPGC